MTADRELQCALFTSIEVCKFKLQPLSIVPHEQGQSAKNLCHSSVFPRD